MGNISGRGERRATRDGRGKRTHTPAACEPDTHSRHLVAPMVSARRSRRDRGRHAVRVARGLSPGATRIVDDDHGRLDENGREFQRIYFWRNILRTLEEIRETLNRLNKEAAFRDAMSRREPEVREAFTRLKRTLTKTSQDVLAKLRNQLVGASILGRDGGGATRVGTGHRRIP